jgi:predicted TIM-barrel fold metal-dependent hydrolase
MENAVMQWTDAHVYLGQGAHLQLTEVDLLERMDEANIQIAIICPVDRYMAVYNHQGNDLILSAVHRHPDRLVGMATANPWYGKAAIDELKRSLDAGLSGLMIHAPYQGIRLSDHLVDPLLKVASEYAVPVYAHTGTAGIAEPLHLVDLAMRFPQINFIMGHAGSSDYSEDAVYAMPFTDNIWLETSRNGPGNYNFFKLRGLTSRIVFGSSAPEYIPAIEIETLCDIFSDQREQAAILHDNIQHVFRGKLPL